MYEVILTLYQNQINILLKEKLYITISYAHTLKLLYRNEMI